LKTKTIENRSEQIQPLVTLKTKTIENRSEQIQSLVV